VNILKLNGICEKNDFVLHDSPFELISTYMKINNIVENSHIKENSEAFSGGGAWDEDDEKLEFYEKSSGLHHFAKLVESSDQTSDEIITLAFGNTIFISAENIFHNIEIPADYIPRKIIGSSNIQILTIEKRNSTEKFNTLTENQIIDIDEKTASAALKGFMPFDEDSEKQSRYIKYLRFCTDKSGKADIPKSNLYLDEKEREEFIMSAQIFRPSSSIISSRFESSSTSFQPQVQLKAGLSRPNFQKKSAHPKEIEPLRTYQPKTTHVELIHQRIDYIWMPSSLLCKRFNVAPPETGVASKIEPKKVTPALTNESIDQVVNMLLQNSKQKIQFELGDKNQAEAEETLLKFPSSDIFEEIFGPSSKEIQSEENRPKATDYFESINY
jgi:hypothetical protein